MASSSLDQQDGTNLRDKEVTKMPGGGELKILPGDFPLTCMFLCKRLPKRLDCNLSRDVFLLLGCTANGQALWRS